MAHIQSLGHLVKDGVYTGDFKITAVKNFPPLKTKDIQGKVLQKVNEYVCLCQQIQTTSSLEPETKKGAYD